MNCQLGSGSERNGGGADISYIQKLLGHKDIRTTQVYAHVTNKDITNLARLL